MHICYSESNIKWKWSPLNLIIRFLLFGPQNSQYNNFLCCQQKRFGMAQLNKVRPSTIPLCGPLELQYLLCERNWIRYLFQAYVHECSYQKRGFRLPNMLQFLEGLVQILRSSIEVPKLPDHRGWGWGRPGIQMAGAWQSKKSSLVITNSEGLRNETWRNYAQTYVRRNVNKKVTSVRWTPTSTPTTAARSSRPQRFVGWRATPCHRSWTFKSS